MSDTPICLICSPGLDHKTVRTPDGRTVTPPAGWALLPPGDPGLTRRVKAAGEHWVVQDKRGRKLFSRGVWAPSETIEALRTDLVAERSTETYAKRTVAAAARRDKVQTAYVEDFAAAVAHFLGFHPAHRELADRLAKAVTEHATPVGSGTVARTKRIPVEDRAEAAVIAWMRHQTTAYDSLTIARVKGKRREVRRMLARRSHDLLADYRRGEMASATCPLARAFRGPGPLVVPETFHVDAASPSVRPMPVGGR